MPDLPSGTVTFLFTDIEGSTRLWEQHPAAMEAALARHDALAAAIIQQHEGRLVKHRGEGDSLFAVFARAVDAVAAAVALQQALRAEPWPGEAAPSVRLALHTGDAAYRDGDYFGAAVNRCARLRAVAHGGQLLLSSATQELVRDSLPEGVSLRDLGEHRLRDLARPERVFQLLHPDLPAGFPPLTSLNTLPNNLPQQVTSFIGREKEMAEIRRLLATTRLLTLTGSGGTGKTRVSLQVAADMLEGEGDGVWLVELAPLADPALVPQAVATVLGIREEPGKPLSQPLVDFLKPKRLLLLLDNCEHLLSACAELAELILRSCPGVQILATSREGLNIPGETTYRLPSLTLPDTRQHAPTAESLSQYEAVRLFIDRAAAAVPSFAVTNQNAPAVAQICVRLDGIPLAIELAAARVKAMAVEQINGRLDDRFRLLTGGSRTALPRQQTLRALIDWSYDLLSEAERALLARLSVFAGGWSLEAAEYVCASEPVAQEEVLELLTSLVEKSLVAYEAQEAGGRYRLLETVRQYARDRLLQSQELEAVRNRHRDYFLALAADFPAAGASEAERKARFDRMEAEHDNLRAVLPWTLEDPEGVEASLQLVSALSGYWRMRGHFREGREWLERALARDGPLGRPRVRALNCAAIMAMLMGDYERGQAWYEESLAAYRELGDKRGVAVLLGNLGLSALRRREFEQARTLLEESLALRQELGEREGVGYMLRLLGDVARYLGDHPRARALLEESLTIFREPGRSAAELASTLASQGAVARLQSDLKQAHSLLQESLVVFQARPVPDGVAGVLEELALTAHGQQRSERAARLFGAAEKMREAISSPVSPLNLQEYEQCVREVRASLGEAAFATAWEKGRHMTGEQAVAYALEAGGPGPGADG